MSESSDRFLNEIREIRKTLKAELPRQPKMTSNYVFVDKAMRLVTLVGALDNWIKNGTGLEALPLEWRPRIVGPARRKKKA